MTTHRISAGLSHARNQKTVPDALKTLRTNLAFLIDLTTEECRYLPGTGDGSQMLGWQP
jgi:hypothetical protein